MKKIKALFLSLVMLVGICALPMQANAACWSYALYCDSGYTEAGIICGGDIHTAVAKVDEIASEVC